MRSARDGEWCCARKSKRGGVRLRHFGKWFTKILGVNHFLKFCSAFSGQQKSFAIDQYFTTKQTLANTKNIFNEIFYNKTNGALVKTKTKNIINK